MILLKSVQEADFFPEETHCQLDSHLVQATTHPRRPSAVSWVGRKGRTKVENYCPTFSPDPTNCPWVSEDCDHLAQAITKSHYGSCDHLILAFWVYELITYHPELLLKKSHPRKTNPTSHRKTN